MTTRTAPRIKITYATLRNDNEELHTLYDRGIERARAQLGETHPLYINGEARDGEGTFEDRSPIDRDDHRRPFRAGHPAGRP